jgi:soluble lytic murein transglycosylase-like protein
VSLCRSSFAAVLGLTAVLIASPARADLVRLTNGRTMTVEGFRVEGAFAILTMRGGGQITVPNSMVADVQPDDQPYARARAFAALTKSPTALGPAPSASSIHMLVDRVAARVGLDAQLAHAVVSVESNYKPLATSPKGAMGLMQIMPDVAAHYALDDPFDPERNLEAGMRHLQMLISRYDDVRRALAAYNAGMTAVTRYGGIPPYEETRTYVQRIMAILHGPPRR